MPALVPVEITSDLKRRATIVLFPTCAACKGWSHGDRASAAAVAFDLTVTGTLRRCSEFLSCCGDDDPDSERRHGLDRRWPHRHASRQTKPGSYSSGDSEPRSARWRSLHLPKTPRRSAQDPRHEAIGISRQVNRPSASAGAVSSSAAVSCNPRARDFAHETIRVIDEAIDLRRWRTACDLEADAPVRIMQQQRHKLHR
ncbi:hypothetical protein ABIB85_004377 [Bradyrhizobium sp. JR1.5]